MSNNKYIYILSGIEVRKLTDAQIQKNFEVFKKKYANKREITFNYYKQFMYICNKLPVDIMISRDDIAYFISEKAAIESAKSNIGDFNDGGIYNYAIVERLPLNRAYPITCSDAKYWYFVFNGNSFSYSLIDPNTDELAGYIKKRYDRLHG